MRLLQSIIYRSGIFLFPILLSGCAGSVFIPYPDHLHDTREALRTAHTQEAVAAIDKQVGGQSIQLDQAEVGRVTQIAKQYQNSVVAYQKAIDQVQTQQLQAKVQVTSMFSNTASIAVNDNVIPYRLQDYEVVMLYTYQVMNYLALGDVQNAMVMMRQANEEQIWVKQQNYEELVAAQKKADDERWHFNPQDHTQQFSSTMQAASSVKSSFENGFLYYLSALLYQSTGDLNNAYVLLQSALGVAPNNPYIQRQVMDVLLQRDGPGSTLLPEYQRNFGLPPPSLPNNAGQLAVIYEQDLVPPIASITIPLPIITSQGLSQIQPYSFPIYKANPYQVTPLTVNIAQVGEYPTAVVADVQGMAAKSLTNRYLMIFVRETIRFLSKTIATQAAYNSGNQGINLLGLASQIYSLITNNPDQRSWLTLPNNIQVIQHYLAPGTYQVTVNNAGHSWSNSVKIESNHTVLLWVIQIGETFRVKSITLT
jgi:hypothetical protein